MEPSQFDVLTRAAAVLSSRRATLGAIASVLLLGVATTADARKKKKVTLCLNGRTVKKSKEQARKLQSKGAGKGACRCGNGGHCFVFVTADGFTGSAFSGLAGADASCQERAAEAGLPGTYKAWLSDATESPRTRFTNLTLAGPYVLPAPPRAGGGPGVGATVASSFADLTSCDNSPFNCLDFPINRTENSVEFIAPVWTGTKIDGTASEETCSGWTSDGGEGRTGFSSTTSEWTSNEDLPCTDVRSVYCFQQAE